MRIAQITDLHLNDFLARKYGLDTRAHFADILSRISPQSIDHIVLTGDFGEPDQHRWILDALGATQIPFDVILGNHDREAVVANGLATRTSGLPNEYVYSQAWNGLTSLFLDSSRGVVSADQLTWLRDQLESASQTVLLFCHHPILETHPAFDTLLGLKNRREVEAILNASGKDVSLFCGHYHCHSVVRRRSLTQVVAPATIMQIRGEGETLVTDSFRYGYLVIRVEAGSVVGEPVMV